MPDDMESQKMTLFKSVAGHGKVASHIMTEAPSSETATLTLRVAEARVEDVGHAIARLAPADLRRIGARTGDVLKITGATVAVGRAELSDDGHEGMVQM